jgi:sugar phosphate isomerase/epimerase
MDSELVMFTKHLKRDGDLSLAEAGDRLAEWGFDGADLTVRPGGYVDPAAAADRLPEAVATLRDRGLSVPMLTTAITSDDDEGAGAIFAAADDLGIGRLKLGYWRYEGFGALADARAEMAADLEEIAALADGYAVTPAVHVHSGSHLTAEATLLADVLSGFHPEEIGAYADPGHMTVEGALGGWELGLDALAERLEMVAVKDFRLAETDGGWTRQTVPCGEGLVRWAAVFDALDGIGFDGPISIHGEYDRPFPELVSNVRGDLALVEDLL